MVNTITTRSKVRILGDWQNFRIVDRIGLAVELIPHLEGANRRPTGERGLYAYWRVGSGVTVANGFRYLEAGAARRDEVRPAGLSTPAMMPRRTGSVCGSAQVPPGRDRVLPAPGGPE